MSSVMQHSQAAAPPRLPPRTPSAPSTAVPGGAAPPPGPAEQAPGSARGRGPSADRNRAASGDNRARSGSTGPGGHRINGCFKSAPPRPASCGRGPSPKPGPAAGGYPSSGAAVRSGSAGPAPVARGGSADSRSAGSARRASSVTPPSRNVIADNRAAAANAPPRTRPSSASKASDTPYARDGSNVPRYLQRIRAVIRDEEQFVAERLGLNKGDGDGAPPGCKLLPQDEKQETLTQLQRRKEELEALHRKLPLKIETPGQRQRAQEIDRELLVVEDGIKTFSRAKVFIRL